MAEPSKRQATKASRQRRQQAIEDAEEPRELAAGEHDVLGRGPAVGHRRRRLLGDLQLDMLAYPTLVIEHQVGGDPEQVAARIGDRRAARTVRGAQPRLLDEVLGQRTFLEPAREKAQQRIAVLAETSQEGLRPNRRSAVWL